MPQSLSHAAGRSVLTMAEAYNYFKVNRAEHEHVVANLAYMEGLSLVQQVGVQRPCRDLLLLQAANFTLVSHAGKVG